MEIQKGRWGVGLLILWLAATGFAFWWVEYRQLSQYQAVPLTHDALVESLELAIDGVHLPAESTALLLHFSDPNCPCDSANRRHVEDLQARYPALKLIPVAPESPNWPLLASLPAAALFNSEGQLLYFGPYSSGPVCGTGINFVDKQLARLEQKVPVDLYVNDIAFGCFCEASRFLQASR